jgi:hypothetical protein
MTESDYLRRAVLLVASGVLGLMGTPVLHAQSPPATKMVSDTVALPSSGTVKVDNYRGSITITTWDRAEVGYRVRIEPAAEGEDVQFTSLDVTRPAEETLNLDPDFP